jgi:drug/metabolite transporter (DMT)-like permease
LVIFITLIAALIASFSQILYKKGLVNKVSGFKGAILAFKNKNVLIGQIGYLLSLGVYLYALSEAPLSVVYPLFASTFIFITILSAIILNEKVSKWRAAGVLIVFLGIVMIAASAS